MGARARLHTALAPLRVEVRDLLVQGDSALVSTRYDGDHAGELLGLAPTSRRVAWCAIEHLDLTGGVLRRRRQVFDAMDLLSQLEEPASRRAGTVRLAPTRG